MKSLLLSPLSLALGLALAAGVSSPASAIEPIRFDAGQLDGDIAACDDLNRFVNDKWLKANPIPGDRVTWGSFEVIGERSLQVQAEIAAAIAKKGDATTGSIDRIVGDFWATGMDEARANALGIEPLEADLAAIDALDSGAEIADWLRANYARGRGFLFGFGPSADFKDSSMQIAYVAQAGLGLPDRDYYFDEDKAAQREAYVKHIAKVLELSGVPAAEAASQATDVMAFETRLAKVSKSSEELSRDVSLFYNPITPAEADKLTPNFPWTTFFQSQGVAVPAMFSFAIPQFHQEVSTMLQDEDPAHWRAYLRFQTVDNASPFLSDAFATENFNFYSKTLRGQKEQLPRWKRTLNTLNGMAGEALGQAYVKQAFPPESKARMEELVGNLSAALKTRIENLEWMSPATKKKALEKWASFTPKIGYPDKWRDWSGLKTSRESYVDNVAAAIEYNYKWNLAKIGKPVDRTEWGMTPQTVNAYYNPQQNEIVFPAAILQPPFFDPKADDALNYGGIGAVIGHEMIHGYDDQGSRFGPTGNFENWWTDEDKKGFEELTAKLVAQFDDYEAAPGAKVNGTLTLGENIADLGGLAVAHDAMKRAQGPDFKDPMIDGYTQDQRFFMNWGTVWRRHFTPEELQVRLKTDSHAPANFRAIGAPSNMGAFAQAFACKPGQPMVRGGDKQILIW
ncbi:M13 family metallopeptidase [Chiayiivirga flava]|uniref:Putative endopeptidase n=1 Tax=Chiayiivirga flava TaxID=659595 RepID=A0A7W8D677_9GAMM|nr:M13-type metalloendopeptidase [Chiayiivirga flava]MBB5208272.1 putative endopeptidase [Chiayiivirga flava]